MHNRTDLNDLPDELTKAIRETDFIVKSYLGALSFIVQDTGRDPNFFSNHMLSVLSYDLLQSASSISALATEGIFKVARRELRFLIEASVKLAFVQQGSYSSTIDEKLELFVDELSSQKITIKKNIKFSLLNENYCATFLEEVGRLYSETSDYVHYNPAQIIEAIQAAEDGVMPGKERASDVLALNRLVERCMAASMVFLFHSVPEWVAGDWLVEGDGSSVRWHFMKSRFIAAMDASFDYKHERKKSLPEIQATRATCISF